jgi:CheY-like chemotaxis protein
MEKQSKAYIEMDMSVSQKLEALGQFAGGIAHDFNNILSVIEGYTYVVLQQEKKGAIDRSYLEAILKSTQKGAGLTRQLLAFSQQNIALEQDIDLKKVIAEEARIILTPCLGEHIALNLIVPEDDLYIRAAPEHILQILLNLAINARDAMLEGGSFGIELKAHETKIELIITDTGEGIDPEAMPHIFEPFFTTKPQGKGTGLGLSVVFGLIHQMHATIDVRSQKNHGTSFTIHFPRVKQAQLKSTASQDAKASIAGQTILLVEDQDELRLILEVILKNFGANVLTARHGQEALVKQDEYQGVIDFLLTDVVMPEMDGLHLAELFQSLRPDTHIVYMSGYPVTSGEDRLRLPSDAHFISKPIHAEALQQLLSSLLQKGVTPHAA